MPPAISSRVLNVFGVDYKAIYPYNAPTYQPLGRWDGIFHYIPQVLDMKKGNDSNLLIVFYVQIMPDDFVMQLHRF